ncbi:MAG: hypothetical protein KDN22_10375 [Verrucomicrobiae bacterium]|nr:hypothetical protein [Verrucomicrobiae bacterium]
MDDFDTLFPTFKANVEALHEGLLIFAYLTLVLGLLLSAYRGMFGNYSEIVRALVAIAVLSVTLGYIDEWVFELGNLVNDHVVTGLGTDPRETHTRFGEMIANPTDGDDDRAWYERIFDPQTAVAEALAKLLIWFAAKIAWVIVWWAYFIHKALVYFGISLAPIFLPMLMVNATRGIAVRYVLGLFSLIMWPLGWAVANLMTDALMAAAADRTLYEFGGVLGQASYAPQMLFFILVAAIWLLSSTIGAPIIMSRILTSGAQIGAALLGGFAGSIVGTASGASGGAMLGGSAVAGGGAAGAAAAIGGALAGGGAGFGAGAVGGPSSGMAAGAGMAAFSMAGGIGGGKSNSEKGGGGSGGSSSSGGSGGGSSSPNYNAEAEAIAAKATQA